MSGIPRSVFLRVLEVFDRLEIPYMVVGSGAVAIYGQPRMTRDVDLVVRMRREDIDTFVEELRPDYYADEIQIREALQRRRSFNLIHLGSGFKFDIFPLGDAPYDEARFARRRYVTTTMWGAEPVELSVISPEDLILSKLVWYRKGGGVSEQQWNDVLGVIAVQGERLDLSYLGRWAESLGIAELLQQALSEARER